MFGIGGWKLLGAGAVVSVFAAACVAAGEPGAASASRPAGSEVGSRVPVWPLKTSRVLLSDAQIARARQLCATDPAARAVRDGLVEQAAYWIGKSDEQLRALLPDARVPRAFNASTQDCPVHGKEIYKFGTYPWKLDRERPFTVICPIDGARFPSNDFEAFYRSGMTDRSLLTGAYADDGRGWVSPSGEKYWLVAYACHWNWLKTWLPAVTTLSEAYLLTGERIYARKAVAMLDRIAEVYPGMDHARQSRYGELMGGTYQGKIVNHIWETNVLRGLAIAYDQVFDALIADDPIVLPWRSAEQIRANIEANLLEEGIEAVADDRISGNFGMHQSALAYAVVVRQNGPSAELLDGIFSETGGSRTHEGIDYALYNLVFKDGMPYETAPGYCFSWVENLLGMAEALQGSSFNLFERPKFRRMFDAPLELICAGGFTPAVGDAGSTTAGLIGMSASAYEAAFRAYDDARYAWLAGRLGGRKAEKVTGFDDLMTSPIPASGASAGVYEHKAASRLLDGYGMAVLNNRDDSLAVAMYYGIRGGHGHYDRLNIELFAHGRRVSPDLGYPDFMNAFVPGIHTWSKNTIAHNCLAIDRTRQSVNLPGKVLRFHEGRHVRMVEIDAPGTYPQAAIYRRALVLVDVDDHSGYLVDVFRVRGGAEHVLSVHGQEGEFTFHGAMLPPAIGQGTLAGPAVAYGQIYDDAVMGAPGYQGGFTSYNGSGYQHFFNWQRVRPAASVMGAWRFAGDLPAELRIHVPHAADQEITVADAYVSPTRKVPTVLKYMLLGRRGGDSGSTFVTVWEMAGEKPIIERVEQTEGAGDGWDQRIALRVHRGGQVDHITMVPDAEEPGGVCVATMEGTATLRSFVAGRVEDGAGARRPSRLTGRIDAVEYPERAIHVRFDGEARELSDVKGRMVRIFNDRHSCMYRISDVAAKGDGFTLRLEGSDVFTGRVRVDAVDRSGRSITTATGVLYPDNLPGMRLVSPDLSHDAKIVTMKRGVIQLADDADVAPFQALVGSNASGQRRSGSAISRAAWVADFGRGDQIEIERCVERAE